MFESLTGEHLEKKENKDICVAWDSYALKYLSKGFSVIPLAPKQKGPKLIGWTKFCAELMDPETAQGFCGKNHNLGLALGEASGVCAVDIDTDDPKWLSRIEKILPDSPVKKKGAKGYTAFFKFNGVPSKSVKSEDGLAGIDFLSTGKQTVLPPSIHPSGMEYTWVTDHTLLTIPEKGLPELSETVLDQLMALLKPRVLAKVPTEPVRHYTDINMDVARKALEFLNPDESYDQWIQVGLALQDGFSTDKGFTLFNEWSSKGQKYDGEAQCRQKYLSFKDPREITIKTLFYLAREKGYVGEDEFELAAAKAMAEQAEDIMQEWFGDKVSDRDQLIDIITHPVGWIKDVADWIKRVSFYRQDLFSVAAATSFVSICYGHKFHGRTNTRTNNYIIAVGPSGSGKSKICDNALWLMANAPEKLKSRLIGEMASSSGLIDELVSRNGIAYSYIDEIGQFFRFAKSENSSQYTKAIGAEMTKLFSKADQVYTTQAYSSAAKRPVRQIDQPCLVIFGQSVPDRLYGSLTADDFEDGFFNRFTLIEISDKEKPVRNPEYVCTSDCYPTDIYAFWEHLDSWTSNYAMTINRTDTLIGAPKTMRMTYTDEANKMLDECFDYYQETLPNSLDEKDLFRKPLTRAYEMIEKYAIVAAEYVNDRPVVTAASVKWARAFVDYSLMNIKYRIRDIANTPYEKDCIAMKNALPLNQRLTKRQFSVAARFINVSIRLKMLDDLVTQGVVQYEKENDITYIVRRI